MATKKTATRSSTKGKKRTTASSSRKTVRKTSAPLARKSEDDKEAKDASKDAAAAKEAVEKAEAAKEAAAKEAEAKEAAAKEAEAKEAAAQEAAAKEAAAKELAKKEAAAKEAADKAEAARVEAARVEAATAQAAIPTAGSNESKLAELLPPDAIEDWDPESAAPPPGPTPPGDSRSFRRAGESGEEFVLIYRLGSHLITRAGQVGKMGKWTIVEYPHIGSAANAYAHRCSDLTATGYRDL